MLTKNTGADQISNQAGRRPAFSLSKSIDELDKLLKDQDPSNDLAIRQHIKDLENLKDKFCALYAHEPKKLFDCLFHFLNHMLKPITHSRFHNTASNISYEAYARQDIGDQFLSNMICPDKDERAAIGGDCIHWAILFKKFIDSWHIEGLNGYISKHKNGPHSFVIINFDNKTYRVEIASKSHFFMTEDDESLPLTKEIPLLNNVHIIANARGKKNTLTQRFIDKNGSSSYIDLNKDEMIVGFNGDEICLQLHNIDSDHLQTLESQEIIDYLVKHTRVLFQKRKKKDIENVLSVTKYIGYTINKQNLIDLFE